MELFAVGALEHLERHAEVHDLAGFQAHVVAVAHLRVGAVQEERTVLLVERDQHEDPLLLQSGALDADAAVRIDVHVISIHALHEESDSAAGHFCPLFETQASCLALSISNNTADTTNNMSKTSNWLSVSF